MRRVPAGDDFDGWVGVLAHGGQRRQQAKRHLMAAGPRAVPAVRAGLRHESPLVRHACAGILDSLMDEASVPDLVAALDDPDPGVCARALHALACDQCKQGACRPGEELFVPKALEFVRSHPNPDVRAAAIDALGKVMARRPDVADAIVAAASDDHHPAVRNMARRRARRLLARALA